ncbi:hypothetical protein L204_105058 [Cryptococcus depauperatus]
MGDANVEGERRVLSLDFLTLSSTVFPSHTPCVSSWYLSSPCAAAYTDFDHYPQRYPCFISPGMRWDNAM